MDDIFSHLLSLTSYITSQLVQLIEDLFLRDICRCLEDTEIDSRGQFLTSAHYNDHQESSLDFTSSSRYYNFSSSYALNERDASGLEDRSFLDSEWEIVNTNSSKSIRFIFKGLMLPLVCLEFARKSVLALWRSMWYHIGRMQTCVSRFMSRILKTLLGSSAEIGWLQSTPGMAPVEDGSARFRELLQGVRNGEHRLPDCFVYLLIPGLFSNHGPMYFVSTKRFFSRMGLACHIAKIHSEVSEFF